MAVFDYYKKVVKRFSCFTSCRTLRSVSDRVMWIQNQVEAGHMDKNAYYDTLTELVIEKVLTRDSICVDVGSHAGSILRLMMKHAPKGLFFAFEPIPEFYEKLVHDFRSDNVHIYNLALSDSIGVSTFNYVTSNPGYSGFKKLRYDRPVETDTQIKVKIDTPDNILTKESVDNVTLIKIDVEGAEYQVMKGAEFCIKKNRPVIVFEHGLGASDYYGTKPEDVFTFLCEQCGLRISLLSDFLLGKPSLDSAQFCEQYYKGKNYYFIAHK